MNKLMYLKQELTKLHPNNEFYVGMQCGLVEAGYTGKKLSDNTCAIITTDEYRRLSND